ncbi:acyltransferase domain-containing protein [Microbacterium oxydans]|uniref:[acyl-carrier-protein] S-malonyltransferase n=1 Tax=Microbacterium oxydans TaxID=82380 RepID=A0A0F0L7U1_9MICO|nr:acyltransferase domain-containing protein [Microbacterium oxydans]KJL29237.1 Erythronolide synthase, modules 1 and 2 [Microbacterium oxydans]
MTTDQTILLFPGQGAYAPGCIDEAAVIDPQTYEAVRAVGVELLSVDIEELRHDPRPLSALVQDASKAIQLSIFLAAVVAGNRALGASSPQSLIGHSFGEIAAWTVGGAFTPADGARIVAHRVLALDAHAARDGAMAVFKAVRGQVAALLDAVGSDSLVIAGTNSTDQIVVSGPVNLLSKAESLAAVLDIATARIASPYAFHNPQLWGARAAFQDAVAAVPQLRLMRSAVAPAKAKRWRLTKPAAMRSRDRFTSTRATSPASSPTRRMSGSSFHTLSIPPSMHLRSQDCSRRPQIPSSSLPSNKWWTFSVRRNVRYGTGVYGR